MYFAYYDPKDKESKRFIKIYQDQLNQLRVQELNIENLTSFLTRFIKVLYCYEFIEINYNNLLIIIINFIFILINILLKIKYKYKIK